MESLALYITLMFLMSSQGISYLDWTFWCYLGLFWILQKHSVFQGTVQGIEASKDYILKLQDEVVQLKKKIDSVNL
jgi:hypothetical protein